jgi:3-dehydroquinate dehydratase/shikimate dehydrogenase
MIAVSILVHDAGDVSAGLERAAAAKARGASLVEWRVDRLCGGAAPEAGLAAVADLVGRSPLPAILTCRPRAEGGAFDGDEAQRESLFRSCLGWEQAPRYLDVELSTLVRRPGLARDLAAALAEDAAGGEPRTRLIVSSHDFQGRPGDLWLRVQQILALPRADVVKVAWRARSLRDNLEARELLAARQRPTIALCMGEFGLMSRVLAGKFGSWVTFASDQAERATAPGQPTVEELVDLYRFPSIGPDTRLYGLIGWPVGHSASPRLHNDAMARRGHDGVYLPMPVPPEYEHFKATAASLAGERGLGFRGASVTLPHKGNLVRFVREAGGAVDDLSAACGAANTLLVRDDGSLACANTDGPAAVGALCAGMGIEPADLRGARVAVLGAGGAARSIAAALARQDAIVVLFNRTRARAETLAAALSRQPTASGGRSRVSVGAEGALGCGCFPVIVNCTPLGMTGGPDPDASPLDALAGALDRSSTVMDTVYTPAETPLLAAARRSGARTIGGAPMFLRQADLQFRLLTGHPMPPEVLRQAEARITGRSAADPDRA